MMRFICRHCRAELSGEPGTDLECSFCKQTVTVPETQTSPNAIIGDFAIIHEHGHGGVGIVYLARQLSLDRLVALKVLQGKFADDHEFVEGFVREARVAAKISHPNIVQAYAVGEENGIFYFAMEFIDGKTMKQELAQKGKIEPQYAAEIICSIADALECAWTEQKIVHQDIKPDNIMLTRRGQAKLADLGLARLATSENELDDDDEVMGTPQYISPEQLTGQPTDVRSDIYSLGATFFHFVTGRFPYLGKDGNEIARQHVEGTLIPPKELNPDVPDAINNIILKMMAKDINARYQSAKALRDDLRTYLDRRTFSGKVPVLKTPSSATRGNIPVIKPSGGAPKLSAPKMTAPKMTAPKMTAPKMSAPKMTAPKVAAPEVAPPQAELQITPPPAAIEEPKQPDIAPAELPKAEIPVATPAELPKEETPVATPAEPAKIEPQIVTPPEPPAAEPQAAPVAASSGKLKRLLRIVLWSLCGLFVLLLLAAGTVGALIYFGKMPEKYQTPILARLRLEKNADGKIVRIAATPSPETAKPPVTPPQEKEAPVAPPKPVEKPKPVTRPEYIRQIGLLLEDLRNQLDEKVFLQRADKFYAAYPAGAQTPEEVAAIAPLNVAFGRIDERLRVMPMRNKQVELRRKAWEDKQAALAADKLAAEQRAEQQRKAAEEAKANAAKIAAEAAEIEQRNRAATAERVAAFQNKIVGEKKVLSAVFIAQAAAETDDTWRNACRAATEKIENLYAADAQEKNFKTAALQFVRDLNRCYDELHKVYGVLYQNGQMRGISMELSGERLVTTTRIIRFNLYVSPGEGEKELRLNLHNASVRQAFARRLESLYKVKNAALNLALVCGEYAYATPQATNDAFLKKEIDSILTAYFSTVWEKADQKKREILERRYGKLPSFIKAVK